MSGFQVGDVVVCVDDGAASVSAHSGNGQAYGFTPGPWVVEPQHDMDPRDLPRPWIGRLVNGQMADFTALSCGKDNDNAQANARLIAAAPDMLKALQDANGWLEGAPREVQAQLEAAIAKATGASA